MERIGFNRWKNPLGLTRALSSIGVVCASEPLAGMSRYRADFMSKPEQKMCNDTSSGRDKPGLDAKRHKNLPHASPIDSYNKCSKIRMSIRRESISAERENER